jgi:hypothetical protein
MAKKKDKSETEAQEPDEVQSICLTCGHVPTGERCEVCGALTPK